MKGAIASCLKETIISKFDRSKWTEIMVASGLNPNMMILSIMDIDDGVIMKIVKNSCEALHLSVEELADLFGEYWMNSFATRTYRNYYGTCQNAKDFFLKLNEIHQKVTSSIESSKPPKFEYEWETDNVLILTYLSERGLIDFVVGLAKGVGKYFKQNLLVKKLSPTEVSIAF